MPDLITFHKLDALRGIPHPFPYQGSKRYLANAIVPLIPNDTRRFIEPFCGSAAVSIAAKYTKKVDEVILADINGPLIDLWKTIIDDPERLVKQYEKMWNEQLDSPKEYFNSIRSDFNNDSDPAKLLYLLNRDELAEPRRPIPKKVKNRLIELNGPVCSACEGTFRPTVLQVDHRIPFRIGGDPAEWSRETGMLLCQSDNRAKSWTCEHCPNWEIRDPSICEDCYWCHPDGQYSHIAMKQQRRVEVVWQDEETQEYDVLKEQASLLDETMQQYIKRTLHEHLQ